MMQQPWYLIIFSNSFNTVQSIQLKLKAVKGEPRYFPSVSLFNKFFSHYLTHYLQVLNSVYSVHSMIFTFLDNKEPLQTYRAF